MKDTFTIEVDHIDNNKMNNNLSNLQLITSEEAIAKQTKGYKGRFMGVSHDYKSNTYMAYIKMPKRNIQLGAYDTEDEARVQRIKAMSNLRLYNGDLKEFLKLLDEIE